MTPTDAHDFGRTARSMETLHALCYFAPEVDAEIAATGVRKGRATYFAGRAAPMGAVGAGPMAATFYVFSPSLVAHFVPACWEAASPAEVTAARYRGVDQAYLRLLGSETLASADVAEAAGLARTAAEACTPEGRALYAGHADLAWPEPPHLVLFHALTLLREHRGDGHVATLLSAGLSGIEALVSHTVTGKGFTVAAAQSSRGYSEEDWAAALGRLADRGVVTGAGVLTDAGEQLRADIEARTDELAASPWEAIGKDGADRLRELARPLVKTALANGAFPGGVFA